MPAKVLPSAEEFERFRWLLIKRGFREILPMEFRQDFWRLKLKPPSPREGREVGFEFHANGLTVVVWTTFVAQEGQARKHDAGWVLIKEGDKVKYFSRPMGRTKNFLKKLLWYACIARSRVVARPNCPKCSARMDIVRGNVLKARYWRCAKTLAHTEPEFRSWDYGLHPAAIEFLRSARKERARYRAKLRAKGKKPGAALRRRKGWKVGRPENLVPA